MKKQTKSFVGHTGLMGATQPGQKVTSKNIKELPPGSVVILKPTGWLIHLHDNLWFWTNECSWCYDRVDRWFDWLEGATLSHLP